MSPEAVSLVSAGVLARMGLGKPQRAMMYFRSDDLPTPAQAGAGDMDVVTARTADGLCLESWYRPAHRGRMTIAYFHGNGGNISTRVRAVRPFMDEGYGVLLAGYLGFGRNPGAPSESGLYADARAALAFLARQGVNRGEIVAMGESLGTGVALRMAAEGRASAVILESAYTSIADVLEHAYGRPGFPISPFIVDRFDSLSIVHHVKAPILAVHGERDGIVPASQARMLLAAATSQSNGVFLPEAGHHDLAEHGSVEAEMEFLNTLAPRKRSCATATPGTGRMP